MQKNKKQTKTLVVRFHLTYATSNNDFCHQPAFNWHIHVPFTKLIKFNKCTIYRISSAQLRPNGIKTKICRTVYKIDITSKVLTPKHDLCKFVCFLKQILISYQIQKM